MTNVLFISFKSDLYAAKNTMDALMGFVMKTLPGISGEQKNDIKLIFSELLFNAIIHGNQNDINKKVALTVEITKDGTIQSVISDEGAGYDYNKLFYRIRTAENLSEGGRGMQLVQSLCDTLKFNESGNEIRFTKRMA